MDAESIKSLILIVITLGFALDKILSYLNVKRDVPKIPSTLDQYLSEQKLKESRTYRMEHFRFGILTGTITFIITFWMVYAGIFGLLDGWLREMISQPILLSLAYFAVLFIASDLLSVPFDYYDTFVIEEKYGFNRSTPKVYLADKLKGYMVSIIIGGGLLALFIWMVHQLGKDFWWQFWMVAICFMVFVNLFYTSLLLPLFNKLTPLEDGELKNMIVQYAHSVNFPLNNILVMDGSKRSSKANAFFSGFGKRKKVVLYDTLIEQHTPDELVAVLAHEIGHYKKKHILWGLLVSMLQVGLLLFILAEFIYSENISLALGGEALAVHLNIIGFTILFSPISTILGIGMNLLSRKNEFEADAFAKETFSGKPLAEALKTLSINTLSHINPHPWYVFVHYSHPPLLERLEKLESD